MVFPPIPVYLDPSNWQQQLPNQQGQVGNESSQLQPLPAPPPHVSSGPASSGSIRPGSMADRARLNNIPLPEAGLKCPRCESTNTKFCYFNNYSLTQPRHFCKTCRRYWTRGGTLRNVPVGGGCRRNKKSKSSASKPSTNTSDGSRSFSSTNTHPSNMITHNFHQHHPTLPFMTSSHNLNQFGVGNIGLNLSGTDIGQTNTRFHIGSNSGLVSNAILSTLGSQQTHFFDPQQPPTTGLFPFQHQGGSAPDATPSSSNTRVSDQVTPTKMEESYVLNLSRQQLGVPRNSQYWPGGANNWTELSGHNSSSTSHLL